MELTNTRLRFYNLSSYEMIIGSCELQKKRGMFEERISFKIIVLRLPKKENNKKLSQ